MDDECTHEDLVCKDCGMLIDTVVARDAYDDLERHAKKARAAERGVRNQLRQRRRKSSDAKDVRECLDYWNPLMPKALTPLDGKRADRVRWALDLPDVGPAGVREAVDGAARFPYVWETGKRMPFGLSKQRHVDLTLILRDETTVERFRGYAKREWSALDVFVLVPQRSIDVMGDRVEQLEWALKCLKVERDERDEAFDGLVGVYEELLARLKVFEQDGQTTMKAA